MKTLSRPLQGDSMTCAAESRHMSAHFTTYAGKAVDFVTNPQQASVVFPMREGLLFTGRGLWSN